MRHSGRRPKWRQGVTIFALLRRTFQNNSRLFPPPQYTKSKVHVAQKSSPFGISS